MSPPAEDAEKPIDFFISYNHLDSTWAVWINGILEHHGARTIIQERDFLPGTNFIEAMDRASRSARFTVAVLSSNYFSSSYTTAEWTAALGQQLRGKTRRLIPVRIAEFAEDGLLASLAYIDLVGCNEVEAERRLVKGTSDSTPLAQVAFPGAHREAFPNSLPAFWNLQGLRSRPDFIGRADFLNDIAAKLHSAGNGAAVLALAGMAGVGKTRIAVQYAYSNTSRYDAVWLIRSENATSIVSDLDALASALPLESASSASARREAMNRWFHQHSRWLLIFDNVENPGEVREFIPDGPGHVLITTRVWDWGQFAEVLPVDTFARTASIDFVSSRVKEDRAALDRLAAALGDLPLALEQASAFLSETGMSVRDYLETMRARAPELFEQGRPADYGRSILTTWSLSFEAVERESPQAAQLLRICAFLAPDAIPKQMLAFAAANLPAPLAATAADPLALAVCVGKLRKYSLAVTSADSLSIHRLVQNVVRDVRLGKDDRRMFLQSALDAVRISFPANTADARTWATCGRLASHALNVAGHAIAAGVDPMWSAWLLDRTADYLENSAGRFAEARALFEWALAITENAFGPVHDLTASRLNNLGAILVQVGEPENAREKLNRSIAIYKELFGELYPGLSGPYANLGAALYLSGDLESAGEMIRKALDLAPPNDEFLTVIISNWAEYLMESGRLDEAKKLIEAGLQTDIGALGLEQPRVARKYAQLGRIALLNRDWESAERHFESALRTYEQTIGPFHPDVLRVGLDLAGVLREFGKTDAAEVLLRRFVAVAANYNDPSMTAALRRETRTTYGLTLRDLGRLREAATLFENLCREGAASNAPDLATCLNNLGTTYHELGNNGEALPLLERAVQLGDERGDPLIPVYLGNLARARAAAGQGDEARKDIARGLELARASSEPGTVPVVLEKAGLCFSSLGDKVAAAASFEEALRLVDGVKPPDGWFVRRLKAESG